MQVNMNQNITVVDENIISKIREMIEAGWRKLKSFVKLENNSKLEFYQEIDEKFNEIALKLEQYDFLSNEFDFFLLIKSKILYIIHENCKNNQFGHCEFILDLFDFFIEIWDAKLNLINHLSDEELQKYESHQIEFKRRYFELNKYFYREIYSPDADYSEEKIYSVMEKMRG